jgi:magnesium transporter
MNIRITSNPSDPNQFRWIDIVDPGFEDLKQLSTDYAILDSTIQDCMEPYHLPKYENYENYDFIMLRAIDPLHLPEASDVNELTRKIALIFGDNYLITIHRASFPFLDAIQDKYKKTITSFNSEKKLPICIEIMNQAFNSYDPLIDQSLEFINSLEQDSKIILKKVFKVKKQASSLKRLLRLSHEICVKFIADATTDSIHLIQNLKEDLENTIFFAEDLNEGIHHYLNLHLSIQSQRTNETMRIMAIFSAFFMPITFIVGLYGMNFKNMPELEWQFGYPLSLLLMLASTVAIFIWFKKNKWL